jgi:hypothetical protein
MAITEVTNPLLGAFQALWDALKTSPVFCQLVPPGNRLEYPVVFEPTGPDTHTQSTTPYVVIVFKGFNLNPRVTSSSTLPELTFEINISTATQRAGPVMDVIWAIIAAVSAWHKTITATTSLVFPFVRCVRLTDSEQLVQADKGIKGWTAKVRVEIGLNLKTTYTESAS